MTTSSSHFYSHERLLRSHPPPGQIPSLPKHPLPQKPPMPPLNPPLRLNPPHHPDRHRLPAASPLAPPQASESAWASPSSAWALASSSSGGDAAKAVKTALPPRCPPATTPSHHLRRPITSGTSLFLRRRRCLLTAKCGLSSTPRPCGRALLAPDRPRHTRLHRYQDQGRRYKMLKEA